MPASPRCAWPLHHVPTRPNCAPYFVHTASSPPQVHCQRLRVAALWLAAERQSGTSTARPKRRRRLRQERLGSAPSRREGRFWSHPRMRHSAGLVRHPHRGGHRTPPILPHRCCGLRKRPSIAVTKFAGRPTAGSACAQTFAACCAWARSRWRRSAAVRRRRCSALAGRVCYCLVRRMVCSVLCCERRAPFGGDPVPSWRGGMDGHAHHAAAVRSLPDGPGERPSWTVTRCWIRSLHCAASAAASPPGRSSAHATLTTRTATT